MLELTREQKDVVEASVSDVKSGATDTTVGGYAGTGKSTIMRHIYGRFKVPAVCAPTGRAASVLRRKGLGHASTIHSLIYRPVPECEVVGQPCGKPGEDGESADCNCLIVGWQLKPQLPNDVILCDEASMVSRSLHGALKSYGIPVVWVGDHGQLPPVQPRTEERFNLLENPKYKLETILRNAGDIVRFAEHVRRGYPVWEFTPRDGSVRIASRETALDDLPLLQADRTICAVNKTRVSINARHRAMTGRHRLLEAGETVMCLKNNKEHGLFNGTLGTVLNVDLRKNEFDLDTEEGACKSVPFDPDRFASLDKDEMRFGDQALPFDYGYCSTCHKAQGGEWPHVLVLEEFLGNRFWEHSRWAYTAASRAQKLLTWRASSTIHRPSYIPEVAGGAA
jgi:exodeoxyribonuclease V